MKWNTDDPPVGENIFYQVRVRKRVDRDFTSEHLVSDVGWVDEDGRIIGPMNDLYIGYDRIERWVLLEDVLDIIEE